MKDIKQIIEDCGIADTRAGSFLAGIVYRKFTPSHADGAIEETMGEIIGALYRRIEKLEEELRKSDDALVIGARLKSDVELRIEKLEEEKECHIAEIKAMESAVAGNAERIARLEEEKKEFLASLFRIYVQTGADTDGDKDFSALTFPTPTVLVEMAVRDMRRDYDEALAQEGGLA
jgi:hypothetical protein